MTPATARALQAVAALLLLLPSVPVASATHLGGAPDDGASEVPQAPDGPLVTTDVIPVDQSQRDATDAANDGVNRTEPFRDESGRQAGQAANETPLPGFITVLSDGFGPGERTGGFGDWRVLDNADPVDAWQPRPDNGSLVTTGVLDKGHYPASADSLLLSPEIDLATGFIDPAFEAANGSPEVQQLFAAVAGAVNGVLDNTSTQFTAVNDQIENAPRLSQPSISHSAVYRLIFAEVDLAANTWCYVAVNQCLILGNSVPAVDAETREGAYILEVERRLNLAAGKDGVQAMAFTKPPTIADASACRAATDDPDEEWLLLEAPDYGSHAAPRRLCTLLQPLQRDTGNGNADGLDPDPLQPMDDRFDGELAYTGYDDWETDYFDLTPWGGQSVWIGFYFVSGNAVGDPYFNSPAYFPPGAGFWGFQVGSVNVTAPAPEHNLRLRPLLEPIEPRTAETGLTNPTIALGRPIPAAADLLNMGTRPLVAQVVTRLFDAAGGPPLYESTSENLSLEPGQVRHFRHEILGFTGTKASYSLEVSALTVSTPAKTSDAEPADNVRKVAVDVMDYSRILPHAPKRNSPSVSLEGGVERIDLTIENLGNVPAPIVARATIVDAATKMEASPDAASFQSPGKTRSLTLEPYGEANASAVLDWSIVGGTPGQFYLFVSINDETPYDAAKDFRPSRLPPEASTWLPDGPALGGGASTAEWRDEINVELRDPLKPDLVPLAFPTRDIDAVPGVLRLANNATRLFVALTLPAFPPQFDPTAFGVFFDDKGDRDIAAGTEDGVLLFKQGGSWAPLDVHHVDPALLRDDDIRLSRLSAEAVPYVEVGAAADAGASVRPLPERRTRLDTLKPFYTAYALPGQTQAAEPRQLLIDVDASGTVTIGDFQLASLHPDHTAQNASFVPAGDPRLGHPLVEAGGQAAGGPTGEDGFCFLDKVGTGQVGIHDPGETVYLARTCAAPRAGDFRLTALDPAAPGGRILSATDPEILAAPPMVLKPFPFRPAEFRFNDTDGTGFLSAGDRLYVKTWTLPWAPDAAQDWLLVRSVEQDTNITYELSGRLNGTAGDLRAKPGDPMALVVSSLGWRGELRSPGGAAIDDGHGFMAADGGLDDEAAGWTRFDLARPDAGPAGQDTDLRLFSIGFGIDRSPPVIFEETVDDCSLGGWTQTVILTEDARLAPRSAKQVEKWNCAPYGADGKTRIYEGWSPDALCGGVPCPPWSGARPTAAPAASAPHRLVSPPLLLPAIPDPYLVVRHQYSTDVTINDEATRTADVLGDGKSGLTLESVVRVLVQEFDNETGTWKDEVLLRPVGGHTTEESLGIARDPQGPRLAAPFGACRNQDISNGGKAILFPCGWWWPTGFQARYQVPGEPIVTGAAFHGSPWVVDRLQLFGHGHGLAEDQTLFLAGKTVRLVFEAYPAQHPVDVTAEVPADHGWRIEGFAVTEGPSFSKDVAIQDLSVFAPLYDATKLGLGPNTTATINVTLANEGLQPATGLTVCLRALDIADPGSSPLCQEQPLEGLALAPGQSRSLALPFKVPDRPGTRVSLQASVAVAAGDDFAANNELTTGETFPIQAVRDAAIAVEALPRVGAPTTPRTLFVVVENRGNVPLTDFKVERSVTFLDGGSGRSILPPRSWTVNGTLGIGNSTSLPLLDTTEPVDTTHLQLPAPRRTGSFVLVGTVDLAGDADTTNDLAVAPFRALDTLYANPFDPAATALTGAVRSGTDAWALQPGSHDGSQRLVAQDAATREIPLLADAIIELPPIDLGSAKTATLTFRHRYDLERAFDAGLVEVSTDGGKSWRLLRPASNLQSPTGYPDVELIGTNPLVTQADPAESLRAVAYTGRSDQAVAAPEDGWLDAEFDLSRDPGLARRSTLERFTLTGLRAQPDPDPVLSPAGDNEFRARGDPETDWTLDEDDAETQRRYWWVQNLTHDDPKPHSGDQMWWSGTAGQDSREDRQEPVKDRLDYTFTSPGLPATADTKALVTWWEWRSGWMDGGTGARYGASIVGHEGRSPIDLAEEPTGWRQRGIEVGGLTGQLKLRLEYDSVATAAFRDPATASNLGWFVDDLQVVSYRFDGARRLLHTPTPLSSLADVDGGTDGWTSSPVGSSPTQWTVVAAGAAARDGGWHVAELDVPGQGTTSVWRFAKDNEQGYPNLAESRLVTPVVDLGLSAGDLSLRFDHRYWFEARDRCPEGQVNPSPSNLQAWRAAGCFRSAVDAGAVEVQVFDPALGTFGPWQPLGARPEFPDRLLLRTPDCDGSDTCRPDHLPDVEGNRGRIPATGYSAVEEHGEIPVREPLPENPNLCRVVDQPVGTGSRFARQPALVKAWHGECGTVYQEPWEAYPISYVFSGGSAGVDGWEPVAWDVSRFAGQQVRFAFHTFTNPGYVERAGDPADPDRRGWSVANVAVEGDSFAGKEVRLRLRVATDSSMAAGEWSIDDLVVAGERYEDNAALLTDTPLVKVTPGEVATIEGELANLGQRTRTGLALGLTALIEKGPRPEDALTPFDNDLGDDEGLRIVAPSPVQWLDAELPPGVLAAFSVPSLAEGSSLPVAVEVDLPDSETTVLLRWTLLQITADDAGGLFVPRYELLEIEEPGNVVSEWRAASVLDPVFTLDAGRPDRAGAFAIEPDAPVPGEEISVRTVLSNDGTTEPLDATAHWTVERVVRKASSGQENSGEAEVDPVGASIEELGWIRRGASRALWLNFTPEPVPGLYRVNLAIREGEDVLVQGSKEFLVGENGTYYGVDFAAVNATASGWSDQSEDPDPETGGGSIPSVRFRDLGDRFTWGVSQPEYGAGITYCTGAACNFFAAQGNDENSPPPIGQVHGLEGIAVGPPVDLTRVPEGRAFATLRHDLNLEPGDGARLEFIPLDHRWTDDELKDDGVGRPARTCGDDGENAMSFVLVGRPLTEYGPVTSPAGAQIMGVGFPVNQNAESIPDRIHAFSPEVGSSSFELGGLAPGAATRFDLSGLARSSCPDGNGDPVWLHLVNYTVQPVLRVATLPGYRTNDGRQDVRQGAQGWGVASLHVSSASILVEPSAQRYALQGGSTKDFVLSVRNDGEVADTVEFLLDANASTVPDPDWVRLPAPVHLAPGEARRVVFSIATSNGTIQPGTYLASLVARSLTDRGLSAALAATIEVLGGPLPDLDVEVRTEVEGDPPILQSDTLQVVTASVVNRGTAPSPPVALVLEVAPASEGVPIGAFTAIETVMLPEIAPSPEAHPVSFDWAVPAEPGAYVLRLTADPTGRLIEQSRSNNARLQAIDVVPFQVADLALANLQVDGLRPDGLADAGQLLTITAQVTNMGASPSGRSNVLVTLDGPQQLSNVELPGLAPGQSTNVTVAKAFAGGDYDLRARVKPLEGNDATPRNDEFRRTLRVLGHSLQVKVHGEPPLLVPGTAAALALNVTNAGNAPEKVSLALDPALRGWRFQAPNPLTVLPGQSLVVATTIVPAADAAAGNRTIGVLATRAGQSTPTVHGLALDVEARPGAPRIRATASPAAPGRLEIPVLLDSQGNVPRDVTVSLASPDWPSEPAQAKLAAGGNATVLLAVTVPASTAPGLHTLEVLVEGPGGEPASHAFDLVVLPGPSVASAWSGAVRTAAPALGVREVAYALRLTNDGNVPVRPEVRVRDLPPGMSVAAVEAGGVLEPGQDRLVELSVTMPASSPEAIVGRADVWMDVGGTLVASGTLDLPGLDAAPNLRIAKVDVSPRTGHVAGQPIHLSISVENPGDVEAPASILFSSANGYLVEPLQVPPVPAGSSVTVNLTVAFDRAGSVVLSLQADGEGTVTELQDGDNGMNIALEVAEPGLDDRLRGAPSPAWAVLAGLALAVALRRRKQP